MQPKNYPEKIDESGRAERQEKRKIKRKNKMRLK